MRPKVGFPGLFGTSLLLPPLKPSLEVRNGRIPPGLQRVYPPQALRSRAVALQVSAMALGL